MNDPRSDPELIAHTRAGDADAFGVLWRRHQPAAWRAARALTSDRAAAEDAVGETFGAIHAALLNGAGPDIHFRAYLLTALRNTVQRRARQGATVVPSEQLPEGAVVDDPIGDAPEKAAAVAAYQTLPERYRAVLWHAEIEGEPMVAVAKAVGTTPAAAAQLLVRARRHLRRAYVQAHISHATSAATPEACRRAREHMGGYFVGGLPATETARLEDHVHGCTECRKLLGWASEAGAGLKPALLPFVLGGAAGTRYLAATTGLWGGAKTAGAAARRTVRTPAGATAAAAVMILALLAALGGTHLISAVSPSALFSSGSQHATGPATAPSADGSGDGAPSATATPLPWPPAAQVTPAPEPTRSTGATRAPKVPPPGPTFTPGGAIVVVAASLPAPAATPSPLTFPFPVTTTTPPATRSGLPEGGSATPAPDAAKQTSPTTTTTTTVPPSKKAVPANPPPRSTTTAPTTTTAPPKKTAGPREPEATSPTTTVACTKGTSPCPPAPGKHLAKGKSAVATASSHP